MNELNVKLQGKDRFVHKMYINVRAFKAKLALLSKQMSSKSFAHFSTLATLKEAPRQVKNTGNHWMTCMTSAGATLS